MEFEFDKEIDSLLRHQAARGETAQAFAAHPDADEISLFAENALPARARARAVEHLAECARCRKILSNLITFNADAESENVSALAGETNIVTVAPDVPWYRRLFAFPQITFAMGALVLALGGIMAFITLQSFQSSQNATVAQREAVGERPSAATGASSDEAAPTTEVFSANASANMTNTATTAATNTTVNVSSAASSNATAANANIPVVLPTPAPTQRQQAEAESKEIAKVPTENNYAFDGGGAVNANAAALTRPSVTAAAPAAAPPPKDEDKAKTADLAKNEREDKKRAAEEDRRGALSDSSQALRSAPADRPKAKTMKDAPGETRLVGGKTFRNVGGIWFDAAYTSQQQTMIRRGSDDYKKLDSGLRSIAENLSGTVVVVWKGKAYRIQ